MIKYEPGSSQSRVLSTVHILFTYHYFCPMETRNRNNRVPKHLYNIKLCNKILIV